MSLDLKKPKGRRARKSRKGPVKEFRCQFCSQASPIEEWIDGMTCPKCGLMHVKDDGCGVGWGTSMDFQKWWSDVGRFYDPDTEDVTWYDKRKDLAELAFVTGIKIGARNLGTREADRNQRLCLEDPQTGTWKIWLDSCTRDAGHDGPCNGLPKATCLGVI